MNERTTTLVTIRATETFKWALKSVADSGHRSQSNSLEELVLIAVSSTR